MSRPRIVLDTNVLVSAALKPAGLEAQLVELVAYRAVELCVSIEILAEYHIVFSRPKFGRLDPAHVSRLLRLIAAEATAVTPMERLSVSKHGEDNRFYECAAAANADFIITGNEKHFSKPYKNTKIVNTRQFFELLAGEAKE
jgi:putative PIN family toxin of toxin-antitoxin system